MLKRIECKETDKSNGENTEYAGQKREELHE
jgi:hypothetical protein